MLLEEIYTNQVHAADVTGYLQYYITIFNFFLYPLFSLTKPIVNLQKIYNKITY